MDSNPKNYLGQLERDIDTQSSIRDKRVEGIYELLADAGIFPGMQSRRDALAHELEGSGMKPEGLNLLIGHFAVKENDVRDWRGMLAATLMDHAQWTTLLRDLERAADHMAQRRARRGRQQPARYAERAHESIMTTEERVFYAFFYDRRPKEEIARDAMITTQTVLEVFESMARANGIAESEIARRLKWAQRTESEHPQFTRMQQSEASGTVSRIYGE